MKVMVLAGGPDCEREVSLASGANVHDALREAGHTVRIRDITPKDLTALEEFDDWGGDVIFPMLHGSWGEGGALQRILDERGVAYVGSGGPASELCMDKQRTKLVLTQKHLPTPEYELLAAGEERTLKPPLVIKPPREGSSIDLAICRTPLEVREARHRLEHKYQKLLFERYVAGKELTVSLLGGPGKPVALPVIQIVPATGFYDYEAKYTRDDTRYLFDIDLPAKTLTDVQDLAAAAHQALGCRHMSRVDFIVDEQNQPWILEVNTIPGFTSHSLFPKAAAQAAISMPSLVDRLVHLAVADP